jgi:MoaA/NifB/PqqE/SkfB family radical SAM enzyme
MNVLTKIDGAIRFASVRLRNSRMPIVVRWQTTNACQARCRYCRIWQSPSDELDTSEAKRMIHEFWNMGMRRLCFSGGEPLMRQDLEDIIEYCSELTVSMEMNTNGLLLHEHLDALGKIELVKISLDGPGRVHDDIRGVRIFEDIMDSAGQAKEKGVRLSFTTTLVRQNTRIEVVDEILRIARDFDTFVAFQPVVSTTPWGSIDMKTLAPDRERLREVITYLMEIKRGEGGKYIRNSLRGLLHVLEWPDFPEMKCTAGLVFVIVESNGDLYACERTSYPEGTLFPNVRGGVQEAFESMVLPDCSGCGFCGALELNLLWNLDLSVWKEVGRVAGV